MPLIDVAVVAIVVVIWLIRPVKDLRYTLITVIICVVIGGSAVIPISMARKWRFLSLHENGVDGFMVGLTKFAFKRFDEIERVEVFAQGDSARLMFWSTRCSALILHKEERLREKLGEVIEFLESKGVKVSLMGKTKEWLEA